MESNNHQGMYRAMKNGAWNMGIISYSRDLLIDPDNSWYSSSKSFSNSKSESIIKSASSSNMRVLSSKMRFCFRFVLAKFWMIGRAASGIYRKPATWFDYDRKRVSK